MMLTDLAEACRKSGLPVVEVSGWQNRGHGAMTSVDTIVVHHTATSLEATGNYPSLGIVRDGRSDLPGPLAQLGLGRDGTVYVIAAGVSYHAGDTFEREEDNWHAIGIEAEHDGLSPWPAPLVDAYARLCAALADHYDVPLSRIRGHKEIAKPLGRKTDPNFDMTAFRARVADSGDDMAQHTDQLNRIEAAALAAVTAAEKTKARVDKMGANLAKDRANDKALARALREVGVDVDQVLKLAEKHDAES